MTSEGAFINPIASLAALPQVVVDDDGRIYAPGVTADGAATPLAAPVVVRDVGAEGAARIRAAIHGAGLDRASSPSRSRSRSAS